MLANLNLSQKVSKPEFKEIIFKHELKLGELQRQARELGIPIIFLFEGWDAAGKGTLINQLTLAMDPRGFSVYSINPPTNEEQRRPFLWRFWIRTPSKERIVLFDKSWYSRVLVERVDCIVDKKIWQKAYDDIVVFEKQLIDDGIIIIKFFLHISKEEQKKRFNKLLSNPSTSWKITKKDWKHHKQYEKYIQAIEDMLSKTHTDYAPWTVVEAHDKRFAIVKVFETTIRTIESKINQLAETKKKWVKNSNIIVSQNYESILDKVDLTCSLEREVYNNQLKIYQNRILELEHEVYVHRIPVIILYQGWDAAGKGGNIKRLVQNMDPRGYEVVTISAPNDLEKSDHYLWRFWKNIPKTGHFTIFDRSWYGRVIVERIEGFCFQHEWKRAYHEINQFEKELTDFGTILIKFWLHIDPDEQLRRFKDREITPHKKWKLNDEDWRNREKWDLYKIAVEDMLRKTNTDYAPWTIVESNNKLYARNKTLRTVINEIEKRVI